MIRRVNGGYLHSPYQLSTMPSAAQQDRRSQIVFWLLVLGLSSLFFSQLQGLFRSHDWIKSLLNIFSLLWYGYAIGRATLLLLAKDREIVFVERGDAEVRAGEVRAEALGARSETSPSPPAVPASTSAASIPPEAPWASVFSALHPLRTRPLPLVLSQRQFVKSRDDVKVFPLLSHTFKAPVELVLEAVQRKYLCLPSIRQQATLGKRPQKGIKDVPHNPWVSEAEWLMPVEELAEQQSSSASATTATTTKIYRRRVVFDLSFIPSLARRAAGIPAKMQLEEAFEWSPSKRRFLGHVYNEGCREIACFQEVSAFTPHPQNPANETLYQSWMEIGFASAVGKRAMSLLPAKPERILEKHIFCLETRLAEVLREHQPQPQQ